MRKVMQDNPTIQGTADEVIEANLKLVHSVVYRYRKSWENNYHLEEADLFAVGCEGLVKAYARFDATKGYKFSTYAVPYIQGSILLYMREFNVGPKFTRESKVDFGKIVKAGMVEADPNTIMDVLGLSLTRVENALEYGEYKEPVFLDNVVHRNGHREDKDVTLGATIESTVDFNSALILEDFLSTLLPNWQEAIRLLSQGYSQPKVASMLECSQAQISRIISRALDKATEYGQENPVITKRRKVSHS